MKLSSAIVMWIGPSKTLLRSSKSCSCETFRVLNYLLSIFIHLLATWTCQNKSVVFCKMVFQQRVKNVPLYFDKAGFFSNKKYDSCWTCTEFCEAFTFPVKNIYVHFDDLVYQQIVGDSYGHKLCSTCSRLISILLREGFLCQTSRKSNGLTS